MYQCGNRLAESSAVDTPVILAHTRHASFKLVMRHSPQGTAKGRIACYGWLCKAQVIRVPLSRFIPSPPTTRFDTICDRFTLMFLATVSPCDWWIQHHCVAIAPN